MTEQELELKLLLLDSGELSREDAAELEAQLLQHPEWQAIRERMTVLQDAGRMASTDTVPPVSELTLERLRASLPKQNRLLPRLLAVAAGLVLAMAVWPHLEETSPSNGSNPLIAENPAPSSPSEWAEQDPVLVSLDALDEELDTLLSEELTMELAWDDPDDLASELLNLEETI